jgi:hypothetical protein
MVEDGGSMFFLKIGVQREVYTAHKLRKPQSKPAPVWKY